MTTLTINEMRRMVLPIETVVEAVLQFDRDSAGTLWQGTVLDARIESQPVPGLVLSLRLRGSESIERTFGLPAIAAAIINYCRQARIPLPRHGKKTLELVPEGFAFCIQTTISMPRLHSGLRDRGTKLAAVPENRPSETPSPDTAGTIGGEPAMDVTEDGTSN
jgi:hypothetical protein